LGFGILNNLALAKTKFKKMKKYSDYFSFKRLRNKVVNRLAVTAIIVTATATMAFAQDFIFIEGSIHSFKVDDHEGNSFEWTYHDATFNPMPVGSIDYIEGQFETDVTVRFNDMDRTVSELVHLAVTETNPHGCSTTRAISIQLEPNNMYLEFASAETQDCYAMGDYYAPLRVGLNFLDKPAGVPIPESRFPLSLTYEVRNITGGTPAVPGNGGNPMVIDYVAENDYYLLVTEATGQVDQTTEYELTITSVRDKYDTEITNNSGDIRLQIRVINHLPQSGTMDMAMAYTITGIEYMGAKKF
jgi:hypothetical protein